MLSKVVFLFMLVAVYGEDCANSGDKLTYPCDSLDDLECIRNYFAQTGLCKKVSHEDGELMQMGDNYAYMPLINATLYSTNCGCILFGSVIKNFYVNEETNNLVISIKFDGMNIFSLHGNLQIDQVSQEFYCVTDRVNATYAGQLTAIIPAAGNNGIANARVSSYNTNPNPIIDVGPKISQSSDPIVSATFNALLADVPTIVQELLLSKAPYFFYAYLQHYICDFGYEFTGQIYK